MYRKKPVLAAALLLAALLLTACGSLAGEQNASQPSKPAWEIVCGAESAQAGQKLKDAIEVTGVASATVTDTVPETFEGRLILVGDTGDEASSQAALGLGKNDFMADFSGEKIVILGGTPEKTAEAVDWVCQSAVPYLMANGTLPFGREYSYQSVGSYGQAATRRLLLNGVSIDRYVIQADGGEKNEAALFLQTVLKNMTSVELPVTDGGGEAEYAIVLASGGEGEAEGLKTGQYRIRQKDGKLWLCAGDSGRELLAVKAFCMKYLSYDYINRASPVSDISLDGLDFSFTCNWDEFTAPELLQSRVLTIPAEEGYSVLQGGATDGTYAYYIVNNQNVSPYINKIYKVELSTMQVVQVSESLELEHANSMTYNEKTGQLIVVAYDPDMQTLFFVDPETLTISGEKQVQFKALSLAYNPQRDQYAAGTRGTFDYFILDRDWNIIQTCSAVTTRSVKQEAEVYQDRVFFTMSGDNITYVYDWDGNYLYAIDMGLYTEAENWLFYGDYVYLGYYSNGGVFYEGIVYQQIDG